MSQVTVRLNGKPRAVEDGVTGLLVPPRDERAFADALTRLARDSARRTALGNAARQRVLNNFTADGAARSFENLYSELTARENLLFFARLYGVNDVEACAAEALRHALLADRGADLVGGFSRGMRQRYRGL